MRKWTAEKTTYLWRSLLPKPFYIPKVIKATHRIKEYIGTSKAN